MSEVALPSGTEIRRRILEIAYSGQTVHIPSAFSIVELVRALHQAVLTYPENDPEHKDRDFFVLSKGHGVMALYPILEARGWVSQSQLTQYFKNGSSLPGLAEARVPGCEANTGSLGHGIGVAAGFALSAHLKSSGQKTFCLIGDGEMNEGSVFEALSFIGHQELRDFTVILDLNGFQAMGATKKIMSQRNLPGLFEALGFEFTAINGHSEVEIIKALRRIDSGAPEKPHAVIAETVKGKGVAFMESNNAWHYKRLDKETLKSARHLLESRHA